MRETLQDIDHINGKQLYYSFVAGANKIFEHQKELNRINVFPVPDSDTGTNLASTMRSIVDTSVPSKHFKETAVALADAALIGARGNSGIIFAQFLYGFSTEIEDQQSVDVKSFSASIHKAVEYAYQSIQNPVEGTMITVIKDWADSLNTLKDKIKDFKELFSDSYIRAKQSLAETTEKLEILAKHKVVDAGAKGFVVFLEGIVDFFMNGKIKELLKSKDIQPRFDDKLESMSHEELTFRYCTEALLSGTEIDKIKIKELLESYGDSIVIAGSPKKMRIHVHTDEPAELFTKLYQHAKIIYQKVDDMEKQQDIAQNRKHTIALLTDSTCDIPQEMIDEKQIHIVPLSIHFGETHFLDRITLKSEQFYEMFAKGDIYPSSAQPAISDFTNQYNYLSTHYEKIIGVHISSGLSGTVKNSTRSAYIISQQTGADIAVIDSQRVTGSMGLIVLRVAEAIEQGMDYEEILDRVNTWINNNNSLVSVKTLKYMVKGGRVSPMKGKIGKLLNLKPIITLDKEGKAIQLSKSFSEKGSMKNIYNMLRKRFEGKNVWNYVINHVDNQSTADWYAEKLTELTGKPPLFVRDASPVLGVNTGPGTVAVSYLID